MKKQEKKKHDKKRATPNVDERIGAFGIEAPKIYRETDNRNNKQDSITPQQKRERQNKKRRLKRSVRKALIAIGVVLSSVVIVLVLSLTVFFKIESITVSGSGTYSEEEVLTVCAIDIGENLFLADIEKAGAKLEELLPYVYDAQIHRKLPATIEISIIDAKVSYAVPGEDKTNILLDDRFKVLETSATEYGDAIIIKNAQIKEAQPGSTIVFASEAESESLTQLAKAITTQNVTEATAIYTKGLNANYIEYKNRIVFELGTCDDLDTKIIKGLAACEELEQSNPKVQGTMNLKSVKSIYFTEE